MNKVLPLVEGSVWKISAWCGSAVKWHYAEASHLMEEEKVREVTLSLDPNAQGKAVVDLDPWRPVRMKGRKRQKQRVLVFVVVEEEFVLTLLQILSMAKARGGHQ